MPQSLQGKMSVLTDPDGGVFVRARLKMPPEHWQALSNNNNPTSIK
jgi:hypothetical protein